MSEINSVSQFQSQAISNQTSQNENLRVDTENIDSFFATEKDGDKRTTFSETFEEIFIDDEKAKQGKQFYEGLINNKETLSWELNLSSEEYDALSCVALALASQETGMGLESGYRAENKGFLKGLRLNAIFTKGIFKETGSASSGLTQMKINDFVKNYEQNDPERFELLKKYGIETSGKSINNLFENPDKSAVATMIALSDILSGYDKYAEGLNNGYNNSNDKNSHEQVRSRLDSNLSDEECIEKGLNLIDSIKDFYDTLPNDKQEELRITFKQWLTAFDGSKDDLSYADIDKKDIISRKYNEEKQLKNLNNMLKDCGLNLKQDDLDYIRYALTDKSQAMTPVEYCAFAWNNGVNANSMKADRIVAAKIGTIFSNPEDFDYDQFSVNVASLTSKYAEKSNADLDIINTLLKNFSRK